MCRFVLMLLTFCSVYAFAQQSIVDPKLIKRLQPSGGDFTDISGVWTFVETPAYDQKSFVLFQINNELFGVVHERKNMANDDKYSETIYGKINGSKVTLEIAPTKISDLNPDSPMSKAQKQLILSRATTKCEFDIKRTSHGALMLDGKILPWTYSPSTGTIRHEKYVKGTALGPNSFQVGIRNWAKKPGDYNISGRWRFSPNAYMGLWQNGLCIRGEMNFQGSHRYVLGYLLFDSRVWDDSGNSKYFESMQVYLYEFIKTPKDYKATDPLTYRRVVTPNTYKINLSVDTMTGKRALMNVGHNTQNGKLAHVLFHKWQNGIIAERENFLLLEKIAILPLKADYEANYRLGHLETLEKKDALGNQPIGTFRVWGKLSKKTDDNKIQTTRVRIYSDTDKEGQWLPMKESSKNSNIFWGEFGVTTTLKKDEYDLLVNYGDRFYVTQEWNTEDKPLKPADFAWISGGGKGQYGAAITPLWRIPQTWKEYQDLAVHYPMLFSADDIMQELGNSPVNSAYRQNLMSSQYRTAEEVLFLHWKEIVRACKQENVPAPLVGALLLQNMRSMNFFDLKFDGEAIKGKSIGITQTPYYILQKIASKHGLPPLGIPKGKKLSVEKCKDYLFDARFGPGIAASHVRMLTDSALHYIKKDLTRIPETITPESKKRILKIRENYSSFFDVSYFKGKKKLDAKMKKIAAVVGYNIDQWQMEGRPETLEPIDGSEYEKGITIALEAIYRNLDANGDLDPRIRETPRNYIENAIGPRNTISNAIAAPSSQNKPYRWFKGGDIIPNFYENNKKLIKKSNYKE